ncbi:MAG: hypothetical protein IPI67_14820 [Myxococcales bacterium]|nr:hypothetical protein [Myxococcales bacterium]
MGLVQLKNQSVLAVTLLFTALIAWGARADAGTSPVSLGEVKVVRSDPKLERAFRGLVERELGEVDLSNVRPSERFVLSAALVQMATRESSGQTETQVVVSATLRQARGGSIRAVIQGRAQATDQPNKVRAVELSAMRAAVRSALGRLPEALK